MERISTIQTASVITQPTEAVEPLTLIEKLELEYKKWCDREDNSVFGGVEQLDARGRTRGLRDAIAIVKQHSDWVSVDERLPSDWSVVLCYGVPFEWDKTSKPNSNIFCAVYVAEHDRWSVGYSAFGDTSTQKVTHWQPLPKPPSEVQDD